METRAQASSSKATVLTGVFVEMFDPAGHCLGQAVYLDWNERPLPRVGDSMTIDATQAWSMEPRLQGRVRARHFDVQQDDTGHPAMLVRIELDCPASGRRRAGQNSSRSAGVEFSRN